MLCTRHPHNGGPNRETNEARGEGSCTGPIEVNRGPLMTSGTLYRLGRHRTSLASAFLTVGTASSLSRGPKFEMLPRTHRTGSALGHRLVGIRSSLIAFCKRFSFGEVSSSRQSSSSQCLLVVYLSRPENVRPPDTSGSLLVAVYPAGRSTGTLKLPADLGLVVLCGPFQ
jgi:hypothetical protein